MAKKKNMLSMVLLGISLLIVLGSHTFLIINGALLDSQVSIHSGINIFAGLLFAISWKIKR